MRSPFICTETHSTIISEGKAQKRSQECKSEVSLLHEIRHKIIIASRLSFAKQKSSQSPQTPTQEESFQQQQQQQQYGAPCQIHPRHDDDDDDDDVFCCNECNPKGHGNVHQLSCSFSTWYQGINTLCRRAHSG